MSGIGAAGMAGQQPNQNLNATMASTTRTVDSTYHDHNSSMWVWRREEGALASPTAAPAFLTDQTLIFSLTGPMRRGSIKKGFKMIKANLKNDWSHVYDPEHMKHNAQAAK